MDPALQTYIAEARELLEEMEEALLALEHDHADDPQETLNALFRAAHTIKGSAGLFGLEQIVGFTHQVESLLDQVRDGTMALSAPLASLLFQCRDHISDLVDVVEEGEANEASEESNDDHAMALEQHSQHLIAELGQFQPAAPAPGPTPAREENATQSAMGHYLNEYFGTGEDAQGVDREIGQESSQESGQAGDRENSTDHWHISLRFARNSFRDGMDPLSFLRYLQTLGEIRSLVTLDEDLPPPEQLDPESCYLGFEIAFRSDADKRTIEDVFEFIREDSQVLILPPHSQVEAYIEHIQALPEEDMKLGEILVECGSLTEMELRAALGEQQRDQARGTGRPLGEVLVEQGASDQAVVKAAIGKQAQVRDKLRDKANQDTQSVRVDAAKLDELINLIGELVTANAGTSLQAQQLGDGALLESVSNLTSLVEDVRDAALQLRMVQIGSTFNRFKRVVRDVAKELDKQIELKISGADTELDKTVVEKIGDPLMHLVRNAMDHGIEPPAQRRAAGKPEVGTLRLNARHDSGTIILEVSDDGKGLDAEQIRCKALEKGLITEDQVLQPTDIHDLIFEPGFSTAAAVTNLSGRGVGMDVVKRNFTELGGRIEVDSQPGVGSTFRVYLPLTLAIIDGFQVGVQDASFVIPLDSVRECVELDLSALEQEAGRSYMNLRNEVLPFIRLREMFAIDGPRPKRESVVVVQYGNQTAGLVVDRLMGELQTVIKPLGKLFRHLPGVGGSTIMGNGAVALILDIPGIVQQCIDSGNRPVHSLAHN